MADAAHRRAAAAVAVAAFPSWFGGVVADLVACPRSGGALIMKTSTPGALALSPGGVARNVAEGLARLGANPRLLSPWATTPWAMVDGFSRSRRRCRRSGVRTVSGARTATYTAMDGDGRPRAAVADMDVLDQITPDYV